MPTPTIIGNNSHPKHNTSVELIQAARTSILLMACLLLSERGFSQSVDSGYEIATWRNFRASAVTHTFDDNTSNQLAVVVPMFDGFGFKLTLFTTTSWGPKWSELAAAAANGHEISSHTVSHPYLNTLSDAEQLDELKGSSDAILANVPEARDLTLAYPYCVRGSDAVASELYLAARGCSGQIEAQTPSDMLDISSLIVGTEGRLQTAADLIELANEGAQAGGWVVLLLHGIDNDGGWSPVSSRILREYIQYLSLNDDKFWVETFANVVRYIRERDAASIVEVSAGLDTIVASVGDTLDDATYDYPITIRRELPQDWQGASVAQDGKPVTYEFLEEDARSYVVFDAIPDAGDVTISRTKATGSSSDVPETRGRSSIIGTYPNPARTHATLAYNVASSGRVKVEIYDVLGRKLETLVDEVRQPGRFATEWNTQGYAPGMYLYMLQASASADVGRLVLTR